MSEKARKRNVVVMVEELKGVAGSGLRGGGGGWRDKEELE